MCDGIEYQDRKCYFPQSDARLPVRLRHGGVTWKSWGRRKEETIGIFPNGGWARLDSIKNGKWRPWHPRPVLIPADSFMEKDHEEQSHWFPLDTSMTIQGLLAERKGEHRVYVSSSRNIVGQDWLSCQPSLNYRRVSTLFDTAHQNHIRLKPMAFV